MRPKSGRLPRAAWRTNVASFAADELKLIRNADRFGWGNLTDKTLDGQAVAYRFSRGDVRFLLIDPFYEAVAL